MSKQQTTKAGIIEFHKIHDQIAITSLITETSGKMLKKIIWLNIIQVSKRVRSKVSLKQIIDILIDNIPLETIQKSY